MNLACTKSSKSKVPGEELVGRKVPHPIGSFLGLGIKFRWRICTLGPHGEGDLVRERVSS